MKIETLKERIEKNNTKIEKKYGTIEKKTKLIEKKKDIVRKLGYDPDGDKYQAMDTEAHHDVYWTMCEIENLTDDIKRINKEIPEIKALVEKYEKQLAGEIEKENMFMREIPEAMKVFQEELARRWDAWDIAWREMLKAKYKEMSYKDFVHKYSYNAYESMYTTDEQIHENNLRDSKLIILDLYNRVKAITGEITSWDDLRVEDGNMGAVLNGIVYGKTGKAEVESIYAGGYNIQRLHVRTLVHERM